MELIEFSISTEPGSLICTAATLNSKPNMLAAFVHGEKHTTQVLLFLLSRLCYQLLPIPPFSYHSVSLGITSKMQNTEQNDDLCHFCRVSGIEFAEEGTRTLIRRVTRCRSDFGVAPS